MKRLVIIAVFFLLLGNMFAFAQTTRYKTGDRGKFRYETAKESGEKYPQFSVMSPICSGGWVGKVFGLITPETKVTVVNRSISRADLDLLNDKEVLVVGTFTETGRGEGSKVFCKELSILVIPDGR